MFSPPLPTGKAAAIEALSIGIIDKLWVHFKRESCATPTWPAEPIGCAAERMSPGPPYPYTAYQLLWRVTDGVLDPLSAAGQPWGRAGALQEGPGELCPGQAAADWVRGIYSIRLRQINNPQPARETAGTASIESAAGGGSNSAVHNSVRQQSAAATEALSVLPVESSRGTSQTQQVTTASDELPTPCGADPELVGELWVSGALVCLLTTHLHASFDQAV